MLKTTVTFTGRPDLTGNRTEISESHPNAVLSSLDTLSPPVSRGWDSQAQPTLVDILDFLLLQTDQPLESQAPVLRDEDVQVLFEEKEQSEHLLTRVTGLLLITPDRWTLAASLRNSFYCSGLGAGTHAGWFLLNTSTGGPPKCYLVGSLERSHQQGDVLHHSEVVLQLLQLLVHPTRTQEHVT